jgi:prepilin-type N-terminal cleavage/methylation domain-containing protein
LLLRNITEEGKYTMKPRKGFTLIELLVVIAIIALLMSILMPALTRVSDQAKNAVCKSNLHQLSIAWKMYLDENKNRFPKDNGDWVWDLYDYYKDPGLLICPYATKTKVPVLNQEVRGGPKHAWGDKKDGEVLIASYGTNEFCGSDEGNVRTWERLYVNATTTQAYRAPLMGDCARNGDAPMEGDQPPEFDGQIYMSDPSNVDEIRSFCLNRHNFHINMVFLDWGVRAVGLKELWVLKWHREWDMTEETMPTAWDDPDHWMHDLPNPYL